MVAANVDPPAVTLATFTLYVFEIELAAAALVNQNESPTEVKVEGTHLLPFQVIPCPEVAPLLSKLLNGIRPETGPPVGPTAPIVNIPNNPKQNKNKYPE